MPLITYHCKATLTTYAARAIGHVLFHTFLWPDACKSTMTPNTQAPGGGYKLEDKSKIIDIRHKEVQSDNTEQR